MDLWKIATIAVAIAVALLLYDRFLKPFGESVFPKGTSLDTALTIEQQVEAQLNREGF